MQENNTGPNVAGSQADYCSSQNILVLEKAQNYITSNRGRKQIKVRHCEHLNQFKSFKVLFGQRKLSILSQTGRLRVELDFEALPVEDDRLAKAMTGAAHLDVSNTASRSL